MGKKKHKKDSSSKVVGVEIILPSRVAEAMMLAEDLGDCLDMIEAARAEEGWDIKDVAFPSDLDDVREGIFAMMTEQELEAYDMLDNFAHSPKAGLPVDLDSLEARIEHADWNTDEYRLEVAEELAEFEAEIAYFAYISRALPERDEYVEICFQDIQDLLDVLVQDAKVLELSMKLEAIDYKIDCQSEIIMEASEELDDAMDERDIVFDQLEALYTEMYND